MRLQFVTPIKQVAENEVEIVDYVDGQPILEFKVNPLIEKVAGYGETEKIYQKALIDLIRASIVIVE